MLRLTAAEALAGSRRAAHSLADRGVTPGDRIAICGPQSSDPGVAAVEQALIVQITWAAIRCGITPVMINPALPPAERELLIADCEPALQVTSSAAVKDLVAGPELATSADSGAPIARPMHYTSGTTGRSKGVWTGFLCADQIANWWADEQSQWSFDASDTTLVHGPLSSSAPLRYSLLVLAAGGDVLLPGKFDPVAVARSLAEDRPTTAFTVPSHWQRLFELPDLPPSPYRLLAHAGSACPPEVKRRLHAWAGADRTWEFYGSTEGQFSACVGTDWETRPGTLGRAREGRELFIDDGVIWCATPEYSKFEYWRDPEKTAAAWRVTADGRPAFSVGDLGRLDDDGYLYIDGRREDLIITGGMNVYPAQVEAALTSIEGIADAAVFGVEDDAWGQRVCAVIVGDVPKSVIDTELAIHLAGYQRPKEFFRLTEIPRNAMGKVQRLTLAEYLGIARAIVNRSQS